ncbi:hypothetical protein CQW23_15306 [Capsicum baccatum]|uniref:Uncharacterized protein n=1 Tax=Capsicum baccatum TaxID=33114 RepID=A0A2G2WLP2_CAPBA|nr:hypothetical protein CQW23_15306 [Capsicum baccatum]
MVLLFNSRLKLFPGKLRSKWSGPYKISQVYSSGVVELEDNNGIVFKVQMAPKARQGKDKATTSQKGQKRGRKEQRESSSLQIPRRMFGIKWVLEEQGKEWYRNNKEKK